VYSRAWTKTAEQRLRALRTRATRITESRPRTRYEVVLDTLRQRADLERRLA